MSFEIERSLSAWAHVALCADLTWTVEPPDEFIVANQRLWAQHCRVTQVLQESAIESPQCVQTHCDESDKQLLVHNQENGSGSGRRSVKDVIPESRLAQYYGNFYYDHNRETCYTCTNDKTNVRGYNGHGYDNIDLTECWMLPEVEYWFRKLVDSTDRSMISRRRRQYRILPDDDFGSWGPTGTRAAEEPTLEARVRSTRLLWYRTPLQRRPARAPSPPPASRKMRARRRQPRRLTVATPPPAYCLEAPTQLFCDPTSKLRFDTSRPQLTGHQRATGRWSASVQAAMRAKTCRCPLYRGTNVSRYAPTGPRPFHYPDRRHGIWWPGENLTPRLENKFYIAQIQNNATTKIETASNKIENEIPKENTERTVSYDEQTSKETEIQQEVLMESCPQQNNKEIVDNQLPSTSAAVIDNVRNKRLYSTVLSMSPPPQINLNAVGCLRLSQKLTPGLIKLNSKLVLPSKIRPNVDHKFEELEKEALEQYKASDESIDTKLRELEAEAVDQYSTSNSNTSCSSGNSGEKKTAKCSQIKKGKAKAQPSKFQKDASVDSVVIYSQNFPDLNAKENTNRAPNLKNFHTPPRGVKKEQNHRSSKSTRNNKIESHRPVSDTDYENRESKGKGSRKGTMRWTLHVIPPKKRHLTTCVSDFSSGEELEDASVSIRDDGSRVKKCATEKLKMSAHGGGDLHPNMRKT